MHEEDSQHPLAEKQVICPHCWHRFYTDQAKYISRHRELSDDTILGGGHQRRLAPDEVTRDHEGNVLDPKGWKVCEQACPQCHLQIPNDLLQRRPLFISVVGAPRSGKTYLLTSIIHCLRKELPRHFGYVLEDSDSHEVNAFLKYERDLFAPSDPSKLTQLKKTWEAGALYNTVTIDGLAVQLPKPFIFTLRSTESNPDAAKHRTVLRRNLVLYDNAGESFDFLKEQDARNRVTQHLTCCDAVLFVYDPLQDPDLRTRLAGTTSEPDPQLTKAATTNRQELLLSEVVNRIRRHRNVPGDKKIKAILAVAVQKYDVWKGLMPHVQKQDAACGHAEIIDHTSVEMRPDLGIHALDYQEVNAVSLLTRAFIHDQCPQFVASAEASFETVRYFPVSALGTSPEYKEDAQAAAQSDMLWVRPVNLQPFRVTHPVLWFLQRWRFIHRFHKPVAQNQNDPVATIEPMGENRIRVTSPLSKMMFVLDHEYAGTRVFDPITGDPFVIPRTLPVASGHGAAPQTQPAETPPLPQEAVPPQDTTGDLRLKITKPAKRGWFRRN